MITTVFETCFFSGKHVNVAINNSVDLGCLLEPGRCPSQSLPSLRTLQNTLEKYLKKSVKSSLDILNHTAAYYYLMPCARFNIQAGQMYVRLECSQRKAAYEYVGDSSYCIFCIFSEKRPYLLLEELT